MRGDHKTFEVPTLQADSVTMIASPVSETKYGWRTGPTGAGAELGTQSNVKIESAVALLTWATTQPSPLSIVLTIDGNVITHKVVNPVTIVPYGLIKAVTLDALSEVTQDLLAVMSASAVQKRYDGRSVKVEVAITWATTQPTNLTMRVKWAKW